MYFGTASCTLVPITSLAMAFTSGKALPTATLHEAARIMGMVARDFEGNKTAAQEAVVALTKKYPIYE